MNSNKIMLEIRASLAPVICLGEQDLVLFIILSYDHDYMITGESFLSIFQLLAVDQCERRMSQRTIN